MGDVPSGVPSVAGNQSQQATGTTGKLSSSYPPIFYMRPGESWEQYWRSVTFWVASEGKSLPQEMQGPRLMQQLRERAGKIVQHLTVEEVSGADGIQRIKQEMERSPIIKLLDQKKVDQRRQKFMKPTRLHGKSIESFLNRAEIYRRENQSSPAYQVGSKFYIGHLLDAARLTKRDLALVKAASQGTLEDEDLCDHLADGLGRAVGGTTRMSNWPWRTDLGPGGQVPGAEGDYIFQYDITIAELYGDTWSEEEPKEVLRETTFSGCADGNPGR